MKKLLAAFTIAAAFTVPARADTQTVTLSVPGMTCGACPITLKRALAKLDGVTKTETDLDKRQATITFDDAKTSIEALMKATEDAGYPTTVASRAVR